MKIGIVGLGLIGGSVAKALLRGGKAHTVVASDLSSDTLEQAKKAGAIAAGSFSLDILKGCEAVFVCVPASETAETVARVFQTVGSSALITDVASVKGAVMNGLPEGIRFVGGHPMAGVEQGGFAASRAHLFENAYYCVVRGQADREDVDLLERLIGEMGAIPVQATAEEHDAAVAKISHLPHMAAYALVNSALLGELPRKLAAGGFKDITRVASSPAPLWESISFLNRENIIREIDAYIDQLSLLKRLLADGDRRHFSAVLEGAKEKRDSLSDVKTGALSRAFELTIDVEDKPGKIGRVTGILAKAGISIANIHVENSREGSDGVLRLRFFDGAAKDAAERILKRKRIR